MIRRVFTVAAFAVLAQGASVQAQSPVLVEKQSSQSGLSLKGWTDGQPAKPSFYNPYLVPRDKDLRGARLFVSMDTGSNARSAIKEALENDGFRSVKIEATDKINYVDDVLDDGGSGMSLIGSAKLEGEPYKFAVTALYLSPGKGEARRTELFTFAAPTDVYRRFGSWSPVAQTWFESSFKGVEHLLVENGNQSPREQAADLATSTDMWLEYLAKSMDTIVGLSMMQTQQNTQANCEAMGMEDSPTSAC